MICKSCGQQIQDNIKFCNKCGAPQNQQSSSHDTPNINRVQDDHKPNNDSSTPPLVPNYHNNNPYNSGNNSGGGYNPNIPNNHSGGYNPNIPNNYNGGYNPNIPNSHNGGGYNPNIPNNYNGGGYNPQSPAVPSPTYRTPLQWVMFAFSILMMILTLFPLSSSSAAKDYNIFKTGFDTIDSLSKYRSYSSYLGSSSSYDSEFYMQAYLIIFAMIFTITAMIMFLIFIIMTCIGSYNAPRFAILGSVFLYVATTLFFIVVMMAYGLLSKYSSSVKLDTVLKSLSVAYYLMNTLSLAGIIMSGIMSNQFKVHRTQEIMQSSTPYGF